MKRLFLALAFAFAAFGAPAQTVTGPQACSYPQYVNGVDSSGAIICATVDFSGLSFAGLNFATSVSDSILEASNGLTQVIALNDATGFKQNYTIQARNLNDPQCYLYGGVSSIDVPNQTITVATTVGIGGCTDNAWSVQVLAGPTIGVQASNTLGLSVDSFAIPAVGNTVSVTTGAGLYFQPGAHIIFTALSNPAQNFVLLSNSYNTTTGALSGFVTSVATGATGTFAAWGLNAQDGPAQNAAIFTTSSSSVSIGTGTKTFTIPTNAVFLYMDGGIAIASDANNTANFIIGQISGATNTTSLVLEAYSTGGTGTKTAWNITIFQPPGAPIAGGGVQGPYVSAYQYALQSSDKTGSLVISNSDTTYTGLTAGLHIAVGDVDDRYLTLSGDATISGSNTGDQFTSVAGLSAVGRSASSTGAAAAITGTADQVLRVAAAGASLGFGAIDLSKTAAATGVLQAASFPALTGDVTTSAGAVATTLASVITAGGPTGSATAVPVITYDAKGRLTAVTTAAITAPGLVLLNTVTANNTAGTLSDTTSITSAYDSYEIEFETIVLASNQKVVLQFSTAGGTFRTSSYVNNTQVAIAGTPTNPTSVTNGIDISGNTTIGTSATNTFNGSFKLYNPNQTTGNKAVTGHSEFGAATMVTVSGNYTGSQAAVDGVRIISASGNIVSGKMRIWGRKTSFLVIPFGAVLCWRRRKPGNDNERLVQAA